MLGSWSGYGAKLKNLFLIFKTPQIRIWSLVIKTNAQNHRTTVSCQTFSSKTLHKILLSTLIWGRVLLCQGRVKRAFFKGCRIYDLYAEIGWNWKLVEPFFKDYIDEKCLLLVDNRLNVFHEVNKQYIRPK